MRLSVKILGLTLLDVEITEDDTTDDEPDPDSRPMPVGFGSIIERLPEEL